MRTARHAPPPPPARRALVELGRLVWPVGCAGCGLLDQPLCRSCHDALAGPVLVPGTLTAGGAPPTWAAVAYAGAVREVVLAWKERGRHDLAAPLATALRRPAAAALRSSVPCGTPVSLVPMPSSRAAVRGRGDDLVADLAARCARRLREAGSPVEVARALVLRRGSPDQVGLGAAARRAGRAGAVRVRSVPAGACLLVDDLVTTGATLAEARRALEAAGALVVGAAVVAATPGRARRPHLP